MRFSETLSRYFSLISMFLNKIFVKRIFNNTILLPSMYINHSIVSILNIKWECWSSPGRKEKDFEWKVRFPHNLEFHWFQRQSKLHSPSSLVLQVSSFLSIRFEWLQIVHSLWAAMKTQSPEVDKTCKAVQLFV